jgi:hypothetical protein
MIADNGGEGVVPRAKQKPKSEETAAPAQADGAGAIKPVEAEQQKINRLARAAQGGDDKALVELCELVGEARLWERLDKLSQVMRDMHVSIFGEDLLLRGVAREEATAMRRELLGERSTPLERVLVDCVVTCWLQMHSADYFYTRKTGGMSLVKAEYYQRVHDRAHRRFLSACKTLATVRRLGVPALQVNFGRQQINVVAPTGEAHERAGP